MEMIKLATRKYQKKIILKLLNFSFDGQNYQLMELSKYSHFRTYGLANYKNQALTTGCETGPDGRKTEIFDMETLTWSDGPEYPFGTGFVNY